MKVQSPRKKKRTRIFRTTFVLIMILILGFLLPKLFSTAGNLALQPFHSVHIWLSESSGVFPSFFRDRKDLTEQIVNLKQDLAVAKSAEFSKKRLAIENNRLRQLLGSEEESRTLAVVVARPPQLPYDILQIDQGTSDGILVGAPVFVGSDTVVGLISHTASNHSFVELFTTNGFLATAFITGSNVVAQIEGYGGGVARVKVPQGIPLAVGDLVLLPSIEAGIFGHVSLVENEPTQPEQFGYITPTVPLSELHLVSVGRPDHIATESEVVNLRIENLIKDQLIVEGVEAINVSTTTATSTVDNQEGEIDEVLN